MKLNPDCIRDILLTVEDISEFGSIIQYNTSENFPRLTKYSENVFLYHINQCKANGFFLFCNISANGDSVLIGNLSPKAHEFLANIRNDKDYKAIKDWASRIGTFTLSALEQLGIAYAKKKMEL